MKAMQSATMVQIDSAIKHKLSDTRELHINGEASCSPDLSFYSNIAQHITKSAFTPSNDKILLEPYTYLRSKPGKDIRSQMIDAFNQWLQVPPAQLQIITRVVEMLHNASLLYVVLLGLQACVSL